ncbi:MAG: hypothetical protein WBQ48_01305, partial [Aeromicrobium sp.]
MSDSTSGAATGELSVGMVGYAFMGAAHSQAWRTAPSFFDLSLRPRLAAIKNANRDEFEMIGGAGSANVMRDIKAGNTVLKATIIYPSTQAADGIKLARLIAQDKAMSDLAEVEVPRKVQLAAPVVTQE